MAGLKKLLKRHGGKKSSASKEDVGSGVDGAEVLGYVIAKDKDLPKLHKAVWHGDAAKVKQLCKKGDINQFDKENRTPLHLACACGNEEITQFLLTNKAKTNLCDNDGRTALLKAIECSHQSCIKLLLQHNADVTVTDRNSSSSLHLAAANGLIDVATLLLEKGININISDKEGFTALHVSCSLGGQDFVLYVLNKGANVNSADAYGRTSLMTAAAEGHLDIVKMLLQNDADVNVKDFEGWKATDHAVMNGNHSCAKIMDEHEQREAQEKKKKMTEVAKKKKPDINEVLRSSSPVNGDMGFSFGGPAADKDNVDVNLRSEGSTSRQSDVDDSWASSSEDDKFEVNKKSSKISLVAALQKVERSTSNISDKSQSRIPVRSQIKSPSSDPVLPEQKVTSPSSSPSKIPRPATAKSPTNKNEPLSDVTLSHSPRNVSGTGKQGVLSPTPSAKSLGLSPGKNSPVTVGANPQAKAGIVSPTESMRSVGSDMHGRIGRRESGGSLPLEYLKPTEENMDSDQNSKKNGDKNLGYSRSYLSPGSDRSNRNLADELGLSLSSSEGEDDEDAESIMSAEVDLKNSDQTKADEGGRNSEILTSTGEPVEGGETEEEKNPAAYLGLDLDSTISSVSDPDISGMSNHNEERRNKKNSSRDGGLVQKSDEPKKDVFNEDTESNWDSSEGFLPSDNEDISGRKLTPKVSVKSNHDKELEAAVERRRENLEKAGKQENRIDYGSVVDEDESESERTESEWEKEKKEEMRKKELVRIRESGVAKMKFEEDKKDEIKQKLEMEREKQKEEVRRLEWERQEREKEMELAESIKKELEEELGIDEEHEGSEEEVESYSEKESELKSGGSGNREGQQETPEEFEEQGNSRWDSTGDEQPEDGEISDEDRRDSEGSLGTEGTPNDMRVSEAKFEKQMDLKEKEMMNDRVNNNLKQPSFGKERTASDIEEDEGHEDKRRISGGTKEIAEDARRLQREEDELLEAYKARQEEMLEQERRMEEELARQEQERIEGLRMELERKKEEEKKKMDELERQRMEREAALQREKQAFEEELKRKEEKERKMREANLKKKQAEDERRRIEMERKEKELNEMKKEEEEEEENKARLQDILHSSPERESSVDADDQAIVSPTDSDYISKTKAERLLADKHREFVEDAGNSTAIELQKVHSRERLAGKSREIKQRRLEAKADLDAVRLQTTQLAEPSETGLSPKGEFSSAVLRDVMPVSAEAEMMNTSLPPASVINSEWSSSSEDEQHGPTSRAKTPLSSRDGGLGSSVSPGLQSRMRPALFQSLPLLSNSSPVMESSPVVIQLRDSLRESKRQLEKTQEKLILSEAKTKQLEGHADDLQSKLEEIVHQKLAAERELFESSEENRVLKHECSRSSEDKKIAESLVETVKNQLARSDEKLNKEIKLRRTVEETGKQTEMDCLNLENALRHLTQEHDELKNVFQREQEQCRLKDELYKEQRKQNEEIIMQSQKVSQHRAEVLTKLETVDESRKNVEASSESLRKELILAKSEVGRLSSQMETVTKLSQNEVESFKRQLAEQAEKNRRLEDTLTKLRSQYDSQLSQLQSDNNEQQNKLENEVSTKHRLHSETTVLQSRLEGAERERDEANKTRVEAERQLQVLREELYKSKSILEKELSSLRENNQLSTLKLNAADNKISSLEAELQTANIMLAERSGQMSINIRDIDNKRASLSKLETELRAEKEANARLSAKLETTSEKMRNLENESTNLRYQLEITSEKVRKQEENSLETQNKLHSTITEIRTDHEKTKGKMSEKERSLADAVQKYKEEMEQNFSKLKLKDEDIRRLQQELTEGARKLSAAEASLEIQVKARKDLEDERDSFRQTLRSYEGQISAKISENHMANGHASALQSELEHSRKVSDETSQRLATTSYDLENLGKIKAELQGDLAKLRIDRVKLETTLKEEKAKTNLLLSEIRESNEGRTQLESLLSQIKSSNIQLEERLQVESFDKTQHAREAEEAKGLWELELRARSKLGAKIVEMENKFNESKAAIEEEKKKTRKALESRKVLQGKLDVYEKRSDQHEKEVQALKAQNKAYRRRFKENENSEKRIPTIQAEFNREIAQYEANITSLRNQLRDVNERLRQEEDMRVLAERRGQQQEKELSSAKSQSKEQLRQIQKLEKLNRHMEDDIQCLKDDYKENFVDKAQFERSKLDLEAKSRIELNRKLADVNAHLEEQALVRETLERSRSEQEAVKSQELENTISRLKREVEHYRTNFHELQTRKETMEVEAERFKDMYESETKRKEKLNDMLFKEREKSAESKALLNLERSRSSKFLGNSGVNMSFLEQSPGTLGVPKHESTEANSPGYIYSQPKEKLMESVDRELSKSIQRHLDSVSTNGPSDLWASKEINMTSSPLSSNNSQYMETLKRNYFV